MSGAGRSATCGVLLLTLSFAVSWSVAAGSSESPSSELAAIGEDLIGLRFEEALATVTQMLERPDLDPAERAAGLVLRSQAHVAMGDLAAADRDYAEILALTPGWVPDAAVTPGKALERFRRVQAQTVGRLILRRDPADARVTVDRREVQPGEDGAIVLLAGAHLVQLHREGYDPLEVAVDVTAGTESTSDAQLVPNARAILVRTEPDGVDVAIDGVQVGRTERPEGAEGAPAELLVQSVALGEHALELSKPCFHTESRQDIVVVDLLDRGPHRYDVIRLVAAAATVALQGGPAGAEVDIDGRPMGRLPLEPLVLCPGPHRLELHHGGRTLWTSTEEVEEGEVRGLSVSPRPNVALVGIDEWPELFAGWRGTFNHILVASPEGFAPAAVEDWAELSLPADVDLALALAPADASTLLAYSPHLALVIRIESPPAAGEAEHPRWSRLRFGLFLADGALAGPALVVEVAPGGPAARAGLTPGSSIRSVGGVTVADAAGARRLLGLASPHAPIGVEWQAPDGTSHAAALSGEPTALLAAPALGPLGAMVRAAWAAVDADGDAQVGQLALANLAILLSDRGTPKQSVDVWKRVHLPERSGIGGGTVQYFLGRQLALLGRRAEALRAFELAAASSATAYDDEGPPVAPAARDRLRELSAATAP